jgi:hypothetical protein
LPLKSDVDEPINFYAWTNGFAQTWTMAVDRRFRSDGKAGRASMQFMVGLKLNGKTDHIVVDANDALVAALKAKTERSEAVITYVRPKNRRGDVRHPPHVLAAGMR